jgi:hypothetical protein
MEQLWYTWSAVGYDVATGERVRATSEGLIPEVTSLARFEAIGRHLRYDLPQEREADTLRPEDTATCLAFIKPGRDSKESSRILANKRHTTFDSYGRAIFFCHLLANLPASFTARDAITLWKSAFWKYSAETLKSDELTLPTVSDDLSQLRMPDPLMAKEGNDRNQLKPGALTTADLRGLQQELQQVILAFLLVVEKGQQIYIAAHPDVVARLVWGLTHALPSGLMQELTFSTYEKVATSSQAMIVGTCWSSTAQQGQAGSLANLPLGWNGLALNWYTGEVSPQLREVSSTLEASFAQFAAAALVENKGRETLENLLKRAENQKITTVQGFLAAYEYVVRGNISPQAISSSLQEPASAEIDLELPAFQAALMNLASTHPGWWKEQAASRIKALRQQADLVPQGSLAQSLLRLARAAATEGERALKANDEARALVVFEMMEAAAGAKAAPEEWVALLTQLSGARLFPTSRETRHVLRRNWALIPERLDLRLLLPWLNFAWQAVDVVMASQYPDTWYPLIMQNWLRQQFPADGVALVSKYPQLFLYTFDKLVRYPAEWEVLEQFVGAFVQAGGKSAAKMPLLEALLAPKTLDRAHIARLFQVARLTDEEAVSLLEERAQSGAVEGVFDLLLLDASWRQKQGKKVINQVRSRAGVGQGGGLPGKVIGFFQGNKNSGSLGLIPVLNRLAELITEQMIADVRGQQLKQVEFFQEVLLDLAPPESTPTPWMTLLKGLAPGPGLPESFQPWLLKACAKIENLPFDLVRPWLTATWPAFSKLFDQSLPGNWYLAVFVSLLESRTSPLPRQALELLEKYQDWFAETALPTLFFQEQYRESVMAFFGQLVNQGSTHKRVILTRLLNVQGVKTAQVERLWELARLKEEEEDEVLETVGSFLLQAGHRGAKLLQALAGYLTRLTPRDLALQAPLLRQIRGVAQEKQASIILQQPLDACVQQTKRKVEECFADPRNQLLNSWLHLLKAVAPLKENPGAWVTLIGRFSGRFKLDVLAEMFSVPDLRRRAAAENFWKAAALTQEEQAEFLARYIPGLLQDQQVSSAVKEFLREKQGEPPAQAPSDAARDRQADQGQAWQAQEVGVAALVPEAANPPQNRPAEVPLAQHPTPQREAVPPAEPPRQEPAPFTGGGIGEDFWQRGTGQTPLALSTDQRPLAAAPPRQREVFPKIHVHDQAKSLHVIELFRLLPELTDQRLSELSQALQHVSIEQQAATQSWLIPKLTELITGTVELRVVLETLGKKDPFVLYTWLVDYIKTNCSDSRQLASRLVPYLLYPFVRMHEDLQFLQISNHPASPYGFLKLYLDPALNGVEGKKLKKVHEQINKNWESPFLQAWRAYCQQRGIGSGGKKGWWSKIKKREKIIISTLILLILGVSALLVVLLHPFFAS